MTRMTMVAVAAVAIFLTAGDLSATTMSTAVIEAPDEASAAICPPLDGSLVFWIQLSLRVP